MRGPTAPVASVAAREFEGVGPRAFDQPVWFGRRQAMSPPTRRVGPL